MTVPTTPPATPVLDLPTIARHLIEAPADAGLWTALGILHNQNGARDAAVGHHRRALTIDPTHAAAWGNLATVLTALARHAESIACNRRAIALAPDVPTPTFNLTTSLHKAGDFDGGLIVLERLIRLEPNSPGLRWGRSQIRLHRGDYAGGLADYECRYWLAEYNYRLHQGPRWAGEPLDGKFIMVTLEQGFGDTLLMARYLPMLKARGARRVIVELREELRRLFTPMDGVDAFIAQNAAPTPIYHVHTSIMSLPHQFGTTHGTVPPPARLTIPDEARAKAARLLGPGDGTLRVGIVWSGSNGFADNAIRATALDRFRRFLDVPGVTVYSLQKGPPEEELSALPPSSPIVALGPELDDFADTAAVVERLDLVIMTDSSVAHLAGSLGTPVWLLLQRVPYWVYGMTGTTTPWYPSMRLYRQGADEDWAPVFGAALRDLTALARRRRAADGTAPSETAAAVG